MKLYAYCLAEGVETLERPVLGISGAPVRVLNVENLSVLLSDLDADSVLVTRENALAHAAAVRSVLDYTTPLPFRFGTVVTEQQLQGYISARRPALESKLASVRGCVEMNVKIIWQAIGEKQPEPGDTNQNEVGAGTNFLAEKRRQIMGDEHRAAEAAKISTSVHDALSSFIQGELITLRPAERLVLSAAHLVERNKITQYRDRVAEMRNKQTELHFLVSGPWPPYSFANIELEFKTQFGVS